MNDEVWSELLELRSKALGARADCNFTVLENFLATLFHLEQYSEQERKRLIAQFSELSEEDQKDLISRVTQRTNSKLFHLQPEEVSKLENSRKQLSFHERSRLLSDLVLTAAGTAWFDLGQAFEAQLEIDDVSCPERWWRPYAHISFNVENYRRVETVDILESVRRNAASIGHPAIVFAIRHWQRVIHAKRVIQRDDVTTRDESGKKVKEIIGGDREIEIAQKNLKALGELLLTGAKGSAVPKESALAIRMELLGLGLQNKQSCLYKAWQQLEAKRISNIGPNEICTTVEARLLEFERQPFVENQYIRVPLENVMQFLRQTGPTGGTKFVGSNENGDSLRPSWKVFRNAYAAWFFGLSQSVVQDYLEKASKQGFSNIDVYRPSWVSPKSTVVNVLYDLLTNQLVMVREPVLVSGAALRIKGIETAIADITDANSDQ